MTWRQALDLPDRVIYSLDRNLQDCPHWMAAKTLIWIIDSQHWPRAYLRAELIERGLEAVGHTDFASAAAALGVLPRDRPRAIVLESRGQVMAAGLLDAIMRTGIPVILLVGSVEANEPVLETYEWAAVMRRPISIGAIADKVQEVILK